MKKNPLLWIGFLVGVFAVNIYVFWIRSRASMTNTQNKEVSQTTQILSWETSSKISLKQAGTKELMMAIDNFSNNSCPKIEGNTVVTKDEMTLDQRNDLYQAIVQIIRAYAEGSPKLLIEYMRGRGESLTAETTKYLKEEKLRDRLVTKEELSGMSEEAFFEKVWDLQKCNPSWQAMLESDGFICVRKYNDLNTLISTPPGRVHNKTFRNTTSYAHFFRGIETANESLKRGEGLLVAEAMIVVEHDKIHGFERSPYFFRFWFSNKDQHWHPFDLKHVSTDYGSPGSRIELLY